MASQPNLPTPHQTNYMDFFMINTQSGDTERIELDICRAISRRCGEKPGKRFDPDLDSSTHTQGTQQQDEAIKPRGIKVKEKEVRGSERPIGGFEKATQQRKKTKNGPKASDSAMKANTSSASGFKKATRKRKEKTMNDTKKSNFPMEAITHSHPYNTVLV
ncbi:protein FAR1-RELATED SEQUENCE 7-like [Panicum miliaceum]|uniref:Protein FAR1-RELATED SEQUENCE 7-like n=1 Tax=Panicum miliaceum TaxID=4540 RepID=A0A3L6SA48_PANMI|nr:protein FAR1-RELATED SEQUENCE 7-like [Panicum miliaceum]